MDIADFFDLEQGPPRDRYGRPLLIPRGGTEEDRRWYTRASSVADMLENHYNVHVWEKRYLAVGLSRRMDLVRLAAVEEYTTGFDKPDDRTNRASGKRLDDIITRALDHAKIHEKADYGTVVHARTEPGNEGDDPDDKQVDDVDSFWDCLKRIGAVIIGTELFTANDEIWVAGTFDHLMYIPGYGIVITDKKTSRDPKESYDVQLAAYSRADLYDYEADARTSLEDYVASQGWDPALINRSKGLLFWIKNGQCTAHEVDLDKGYESAKIATLHVRDVHRKKKRQADDVTSTIESTVAEQRARLSQALSTAPSVDALLAIWNNPAAQAIWTDELTAVGAARKGSL